MSEVGSFLALVERIVGADVVQTVDARRLHEWLEVKTPFSIWIERRVKEYGFIDGKDFLTFLLESGEGAA